MGSLINLAEAADAHFAVRQHESQHSSHDPAEPVALLRYLDVRPSESLAIDVHRHASKTASRILRDGGDDESVVVSLLNDMGNFGAERMLGEFAASVLRRCIAKDDVWLLERHAVFQGCCRWRQFGMDHDARERWRGHPHLEQPAHICEANDPPPFDPADRTMPGAAFEPALRRSSPRTRRQGDGVVL